MLSLHITTPLNGLFNENSVDIAYFDSKSCKQAENHVRESFIKNEEKQNIGRATAVVDCAYPPLRKLLASLLHARYTMDLRIPDDSLCGFIAQKDEMPAAFKSAFTDGFDG